jgi:hypothetical protein
MTATRRRWWWYSLLPLILSAFCAAACIYDFITGRWGFAIFQFAMTGVNAGNYAWCQAASRRQAPQA